jgi:hypothetical protein
MHTYLLYLLFACSEKKQHFAAALLTRTITEEHISTLIIGMVRSIVCQSCIGLRHRHMDLSISADCSDGGIGRRSGLKIRRPQGHASSTLAPSTIKIPTR